MALELVDVLLSGMDFAFWASVFRDLPGPGLAFSSGVSPDLERVYEETTAALEANPHDVEARFKRGVVCQSKCCYREAIADFSEVLRHQPDHARAWLLLSEVLSNIGEHERAAKARQQAIELDPTLI